MAVVPELAIPELAMIACERLVRDMYTCMYANKQIVLINLGQQ
jgi:hypothetical protein